MKSKNAFTLIELLVVIAIITMLLAILIPTLNTVKKQATGAVCLANLSGIANAGGCTQGKMTQSKDRSTSAYADGQAE